jgi:hypothetical protein
LKSTLSVFRDVDPISPGGDKRRPGFARVSVVFDEKDSGTGFHSD